MGEISPQIFDTLTSYSEFTGQKYLVHRQGSRHTVETFRMLINGKIVYNTSINGKRVFKFATYNKPFLRVYYENNKRFFRL